MSKGTSKSTAVWMNSVIQDDVRLCSFKKLDYVRFFIPMIVIYHNTKDYGEKYIARLWTYDTSINKHIPTKFVCVNNTLEGLENEIPRFFTAIDRNEQDDECIVKIYL